MILRIVVIAIIAVGAMVAIKSGTVLRGIGLLANCDVIAPPAGAIGEWRVCTEGKLDGRYDLSDHCVSMGARDGKEYWTCPHGPGVSRYSGSTSG